MTTTEPTIDEKTELAKERNREAADRTLMAWIRTSLSLIGFGFGIDVITRGLEKTALGDAPNLALNARILGLSFIIVAVFAVIVAMAQYRQELKMIEAGGYRYKPSFPLGLLVAAALCLIGLFAGISIVLGALAS
jgi:putative membrane protein